MKHRCAVCWEWASSHDEWFKHVSDEHGAELTPFGYDMCKKKSCPGVEHAHKLPNYGVPSRRRARPEPQPFQAKDGTTYTPQPLFSATESKTS